ncbi:MAG: beta-ketoacyl synthase, partial [Desulfobacteraceae bacterium]|nr:beta-ketoacyl synthase [Desulfobacteraceae bacterium]
PRPGKNETLRTKIGCAIGIEFDYGATDFHVRWKINHLHENLKNAISPALDFNRTLGALGGIVASRVAREFKLGGPCFTISAGAVSGIKAIEIGINSLMAHETDTFICGCVDLCGDIRQYQLNQAAKPYIKEDTGLIPSEGAAAVVLKRLDQAIQDNDRIYGVINGVAGTSAGEIPGEKSHAFETTQQRYHASLKNTLADSGIHFSDIGLYETHCASDALDGGIETRVLDQFTTKTPKMCTIGSASAFIGDTKGVSGLFSVIKAALCLYHHQFAPSRTLLKGPFQHLDPKAFAFPSKACAWEKKNSKQARRACVASLTLDGACSHIIIEEFSHGKAFEKTLTAPGKEIPSEEIVLKTGRPISDEILSAIQLQISRNALPDALPGTQHIDPSLFTETTQATANAHEKFLDLSQKNMKELAQQFGALASIAGNVVQDPQILCQVYDDGTAKEEVPVANKPFLDREKCLEFAVGKAGNVLGDKFDIIDTYPARVRLPDEPLMLVDRIIDIQGEMMSLTKGKIITQHDVKENAWYLDGNRAPVSISIEAGQADLFLCSYLGIDHVVKGKRKYRLLDAKVTFHRPLPIPGETIEYHIEIDRFLKQGDIYLFFFHYKGYIGDELLISMRDGCAGFFTPQEVENSGGIILKSEDLEKVCAKKVFHPLVPAASDMFLDSQVTALRNGDLETAFGKDFHGITLGNHLTLPGGRMHLIDRVLEFDPCGGRFGMGSITAEADIHPDDWFLTCHFIDDMVMPGTLMYECCAHALRIFTQRMGWITSRNDVYYDVLQNNESDLKCRGPVTRQTRKARYEIEIKEMGYDPEPYIVADAHMFSDELRIVLYKNMGMILKGLSKSEIESFWRK